MQCLGNSKNNNNNNNNNNNTYTNRVEIEPSKQIVLATISGKIRKNLVRILVGDSVVCELSAYDLTRGRITYRNK